MIFRASGPICAAVSNLLDDILRTKLIPALTGKSPPRVCLVRSASTNGWVIPFQQADREHLSSLMVTSAKTTLYCRTRPMDTRSLPSNWNLRLSLETKTGTKAACELTVVLPDSLWRSVELASEKGSSLFCHFQSTALPYTKELFMMPWYCDMAGHQTDYHLIAPVVPPSQLNMPCHAPKVAFHQSGIMRYGT